MKIQKIQVKNLKSVSEEIADFNGCSVVVTAGNRAGKSTMLKTLIDRFRGEIPDKILKDGEANGYYQMHLTDGAKIIWKFTEKTESFSFITPDGIEMKQGVIKGIGEKYFGVKFDIDKFINSSPKDQNAILAKLVGLDFKEIDQRYADAYTERTIANRKLKEIASQKVQEPEKVDRPDIESLKKELNNIRLKNSDLKKNWKKENELHQQKIIDFNDTQKKAVQILKISRDHLEMLNNLKDTKYESCIDFSKAQDIFSREIQPKEEKPLTSFPEPNYLPEFEIEQKIEDANKDLRAFDRYQELLKTYNEWVENGKKAREEANKADDNVKAIEEEKRNMIANAKIPEGFEFSNDGLLYNGFALSNSDISSSEKYIAGLKLGMMSLGKLESIHFDASYLDRKSLNDVNKWAEKNEVQLLIERPDFEGSEEIKYEII